MILTADEYRSMKFPVLSEDNLESSVMRSCYIIDALTDGRAEGVVKSGGKAAELVKQAACFQAFLLMNDELTYENGSSQSSGSEKVTIGDYSYSTEKSESSSAQTTRSDSDTAGVNVIRLLRAAGCMYSGAEAIE